MEHNQAQKDIKHSGLQKADSQPKGIALPQATHSGDLSIGGVSIFCAVLEDGTRVLSQRSFNQAIGKQGRPRERASFDPDGRPAFLSASNLEPFISDELRKAWTPIPFRLKGGKGGGGPSIGYRAELLPQVCNVYLDAAEAGQLKDAQTGILKQCRILIRGLATVGIVALVDEATGYQYERDRNELHRILEAYISKELLPWTKRFPDEFYEQMFRLRGWQYSPISVAKPKYVGKLTNEIVYKRLPSGVLEELRNLNPVDESGYRKFKHHQLLTEDIGNVHLERHLAVVTALMRASSTWRKFESLLERAVPKPGKTLPLPFPDDDETD